MTKGQDADCPECGANRWKTVKKFEKWQCRSCGIVKKVGAPWFNTDEDSVTLKNIAQLPAFTGDSKYPVKIPWWKKMWEWIWK